MSNPLFVRRWMRKQIRSYLVLLLASTLLSALHAQSPTPLAQQPAAAPATTPVVPRGVARRTPPLIETRLDLTNLRFIGFSADGKWVRVGNTKGRFLRLSTSTLTPLAESEALPPFGVASGSITKDKRSTAIGNWRGLAVLFDSQTQEVSGEFPADAEADPTPMTAMRIDDRGQWLVTGQRSSIVRMHNIQQSTMRWESVKLEQEVSGVDISSDGKLVAVSTGVFKDFNAPGKLVVLDATNGQIMFQHTDMSSKVK